MTVQVKSPSVSATILHEVEVDIKPLPDPILPNALLLPRVTVTSPTPSSTRDIKPIIRPKRAIPSHIATKLSFPVITFVPTGYIRRSEKPTLVVKDDPPAPVDADAESDDSMSSAPSEYNEPNNHEDAESDSSASSDRSDSGSAYVEDEETGAEEGGEEDQSGDDFVDEEEIDEQGEDYQMGSDNGEEEENTEDEAGQGRKTKKSIPQKSNRKPFNPAIGQAKSSLPTPPQSSKQSGPSSSSSSSKKRGFADHSSSSPTKRPKKANPNGSYITGTFSSAEDLDMYIYRSENPSRNWDELAKKMGRKSGAVNTHWKIVHKKIVELLSRN